MGIGGLPAVCTTPGCERRRTSDNRWCQECNEAAARGIGSLRKQASRGGGPSEKSTGRRVATESFIDGNEGES